MGLLRRRKWMEQVYASFTPEQRLPVDERVEVFWRGRSMTALRLYTDGSCAAPGAVGGWAWILVSEHAVASGSGRDSRLVDP